MKVFNQSKVRQKESPLQLYKFHWTESHVEIIAAQTVEAILGVLSACWKFEFWDLLYKKFYYFTSHNLKIKYRGEEYKK